jgi:hypothetical protein
MPLDVFQIVFEFDTHTAIGAQIPRHGHKFKIYLFFFQNFVCPENVMNGIEK